MYQDIGLMTTLPKNKLTFNTQYLQSKAVRPLKRLEIRL
jgi:hypothetical protein